MLHNYRAFSPLTHGGERTHPATIDIHGKERLALHDVAVLGISVGKGRSQRVADSYGVANPTPGLGSKFKEIVGTTPLLWLIQAKQA